MRESTTAATIVLQFLCCCFIHPSGGLVAGFYVATPAPSCPRSLRTAVLTVRPPPAGAQNEYHRPVTPILPTASSSSSSSRRRIRRDSSSTALHGIPKMFRWLTDLYPDILNKELQEGLSTDLDVDNFYLDMNGPSPVSACAS